MREASEAACSPVVWSDRAVSGGAVARLGRFLRAKQREVTRRGTLRGTQDWKMEITKRCWNKVKTTMP